ncbi:MAG: cysteine desulfurase [Alphaproteobacteria bacterium]|nr:MAG: cysteine desulfurase [Alphaproteobacteria bacterium]
MSDWAVISMWLEFVVRWTHVVTAIAWIGSSFYFIALDLGLRRDPPPASGADGEEWQVHGGGFYHIEKYLVAPPALPEHLTWFKWESYSTWLSGAALLALVYWMGADLYLLAPHKAELSAWQGIVLSAASLTIGWLVYDRLCRTSLAGRPTLLMLVLFVLLVAMGWGYNQVFSGRAVMLHLGAFTATIMTANVFFIIIPNQKIVVADLRAGRRPDPALGAAAKLRSTHNNYLTLPVVFLMLSNHYPLAFAGPNNWLIAGLVFLMGVSIRHWFNTRHARAGNPHWTWVVTALLFIAIMWLSTAPAFAPVETAQARPMTATEKRFAEAPGFEAAFEAVATRCTMCHAREPVFDGIAVAPKGVLLETPAEVAAHAREVYLQAGLTSAMPPANASFMEEDERAAIRAWYRAASQ